MDPHAVAQRAHVISEALAQRGATYTPEEIKEILEILHGVSLKLIITNVPKEVYVHSAAKEAFEGLFKSFDSRATFCYLPSFNRAQVYVTRPEAALFARLQTQGWTLPSSVMATIANSVESNRGSDECNHLEPGGISCYIAQSGDASAILEDDAEASGDDEDGEDDFVEHGEENDDYVVDDHATFQANPEEHALESNISDAMKDDACSHSPVASSSAGHDSHAPAFVVESARTSSESLSPQSQRPASSRSFGGGINRPDHESASEASGDEDTTSQLISVNPVHHSIVNSSTGCSSTKCDKVPRRSSLLRRRRRSMHHLAPPKPTRQFLLSPPSSPPVGWEPKPECQPVINYDLLQALAALNPGESFELHPPDQENRHPSILVTPCQSASTAQAGQKPRIVQTKCPERAT